MQLYRPFLFLGFLLSLLTALMAFVIGPWAGRTADYVAKDARRLVQYLPFEPGRFSSVADGRAVFYTSDTDKDREKLNQVFAQVETDKGVSIVVANEGRQRLNTETGDREISLYGGWRYDGLPGAATYDILRFEEFDTRVTPPQFIYNGGRRRIMETRVLWNSSNPEDRAELHWRIAGPLSVLLLTLLAVPLSYVAPRQGRYGKVVAGMMVYLVYSNLIGIGETWIAKGRIPDSVGLWWAHGLMLLVTLLLIGQRLHWWQRWRPRLAAAAMATP